MRVFLKMLPAFSVTTLSKLQKQRTRGLWTIHHYKITPSRDDKFWTQSCEMMMTLNSHVPESSSCLMCFIKYEGLAVQHESILNTTPKAHSALATELLGSILCFSDVVEGKMNVYIHSLPCKSATFSIWVLLPPSQLLFSICHYFKITAEKNSIQQNVTRRVLGSSSNQVQVSLGNRRYP